jgi:hypothetical protein
MNRKISLTVITLCAIAIVSFSSFPIRADTLSPVISTPMAFTPSTQFPMPTTNGSVGFGQLGYYENATLVNDTWVFTHLQLDSQQTDLLSDSQTTANLNITAQDSNVTLTSFERLLTPDTSDYQNSGSWLTAGWLNYTVNGVGKQIIKMQFNLVNWTLPPQDEINGTFTWPMGVQVYIDGKEAQYNNTWTTINGIIPYGTGLIVNNANSNVSIKYAWAPVPASQSLSSPNLENTKASPETPPMFYIMIVAIASGIIVPAAVFTNRHRLESIINKRVKRKQDPC